MESLKNALMIIAFFILLGWTVFIFINHNKSDNTVSDNTIIKDYRYGLTVTTPDGETVGEAKIAGDIIKKPRDGFFIKDIKNNMLLEIHSDGTISYYPMSK
jgi:hypothetical protein